MTIRDYLKRKKRISFAVLHLGVFIFFGGAIAGFSGSKMFGIAILGFVVAGVGTVYLARVRCPQCKERIGTLLGPVGGNYSIPPKFRFCPFCGVELDTRIPNGRVSSAVGQRDR